MTSDIMLTAKQQETLLFIRDFSQELGRLPTLEEVCQGLGVSARSTAHRHVQQLIDKGFLNRVAGKAAYSLASEPTGEHTLPYHGKIAAGAPIEAIPGHDDMDVAAMFCGPKRYILRVSGDSMIEAGILDDDYVVIEKIQQARPGDIVVALIDNWEATLKYYHPQLDGTVELRPANSALKSMHYPANSVRIQGVMVGLFRNTR